MNLCQEFRAGDYIPGQGGRRSSPPMLVRTT